MIRSVLYVAVIAILELGAVACSSSSAPPAPCVPDREVISVARLATLLPPELELPPEPELESTAADVPELERQAAAGAEAAESVGAAIVRMLAGDIVRLQEALAQCRREITASNAARERVLESIANGGGEP